MSALLLKGLVVLAVLLLAAGVWVRLAPVDVARWHLAPAVLPVGEYSGANSHTVVRQLSVPAVEALSFADVAILDTPRTLRIAGEPGVGMATYETRSLIWGFPDYTTVVAGEGTITFHGRARFGQSDLGVNRKRIEAWIRELNGHL